MNIARFKHLSIECQGSVYLIGGLGEKDNMPMKTVEAYDVRLTPEWRRCSSMFIERSEFHGCSHPDSHLIYVFGGTLRPEERYIIERYDSKEDKWEVLAVRLHENFPFLDIFYT